MRARLQSFGARWVDELARNLVYAARSMGKNPGFTAVAVLSLALGIGVNAAVFSLLYHLILAKAPVRAPERLELVVLSAVHRDYYRISYPKFEMLRDNFDVFEDLFGWSSREFELVADNRNQPVQCLLVTGNYFDSLGIRPALGRLIRPEDDRPGAGVSAVLSFQLWQTFFGGDPNVVGRAIKVGSETYQIVGVAPGYFLGLERGGAPPDVYIPFHAAERFAPGLVQNEGAMGFYTMGHVKREVPLEKARAELRDGWPRFSKPRQALLGDHSRPEYMKLEDGSSGVSSVRLEFSKAIIVLMCLVGVVFLIACANLATLLFVRAMTRMGETSVRLALGASRLQLVRQWMTECLLLALLGGATGLVLARWITGLLLLFVPEDDRAWLRFEMSFVVVAATLGLTLVAGLLFGLLPAIRASRGDGHLMIKEHAAAVVGHRSRAAQVFMVAQFAACFVLVTSAVLFTRTLWNLNRMSLGFDRHAIVYGDPQFGLSDFPRDRRSPAMREALERLKGSPNIESASMGNPPIVWGSGGWGWITVTGYVPADGEANVVYFKSAAPGYFHTLGIPFLAGRDFDERDTMESASRVAIVDESFVKHYSRDRNPLGLQIIFTRNQTPIEIIGVVKDSKDSGVREEEKDVVYSPIRGTGWGALVVRAKPGVSASTCEAEIRSVLSAVAKNVPVEVGTLEEAVQESLGRDRLTAQLSSALGLLGLLLASIGVYGTTAQSVTTRTREIGLRMALGATPKNVAAMVSRQNWRVTAAGVLIGLPAAVVASRLVESLLFGASVTDPLTLVLSVALLAGVGLLAGLRPALRAARVDPSRSLRYE